MKRDAQALRVALPAPSKGTTKSTGTHGARQATNSRKSSWLAALRFYAAPHYRTKRRFQMILLKNAEIGESFLLRLRLVLTRDLLLHLWRNGLVVAELHCETAL